MLLNIEQGDLTVLESIKLNPQTKNMREKEEMEKVFKETVTKIGSYVSKMQDEGDFDKYFSKFIKYVLWDVEDLENSFKSADTGHFSILMGAEGIHEDEKKRYLKRIDELNGKLKEGRNWKNKKGGMKWKK